MILLTVKVYGSTGPIQVRADDLTEDTLNSLCRAIKLVEGGSLSHLDATELKNRGKRNPRIGEFVNICAAVSPAIRAYLALADDRAAAPAPAPAPTTAS